MIWTCAQLVAFFSTFVTLEPGVESTLTLRGQQIDVAGKINAPSGSVVLQTVAPSPDSTVLRTGTTSSASAGSGRVGWAGAPAPAPGSEDAFEAAMAEMFFLAHELAARHRIDCGSSTTNSGYHVTSHRGPMIIDPHKLLI